MLYSGSDRVAQRAGVKVGNDILNKESKRGRAVPERCSSE